MAITKVLQQTQPRDLDNPKLGAGDIRLIKEALDEWMSQGGEFYWPNSGTIDADSGKRIVGIGTTGFATLLWENNKSSAMLEAWGTDGVAETSLFDFKANGIITTGTITSGLLVANGNFTALGGISVTGPIVNVSDITMSGTLSGGTVEGVNVTSGTNPGHQHEITYYFRIDHATATRDDGIFFENLGNGKMTLLELKVALLNNTGTCIIEVERKANGWTSPQASGTTMLTAPLSIASGIDIGTFSIDSGNDVLEVGDMLGIFLTAGPNSLRNFNYVAKFRLDGV